MLANKKEANSLSTVSLDQLFPEVYPKGVIISVFRTVFTFRLPSRIGMISTSCPVQSARSIVEISSGFNLRVQFITNHRLLSTFFAAFRVVILVV